MEDADLALNFKPEQRVKVAEVELDSGLKSDQLFPNVLSVSTFLAHAFLKVPRFRPFVLLIGATCRSR
jgi:hypothetical protein